MPYALVTNDADEVVGAWSGPGPGVPASQPGRTVTSCTAIQHRTASDMRFKGGGARWKFIASVLEAAVDTRPIARFVSGLLTTAAGPVEIDLDVGDAPGSVDMQIISKSGTIRSTINLSRKIDIGGKKLRVRIVNGVATLTIPTARAREITIDSNEFFQVEDTLTISVVETEL